MLTVADRTGLPGDVVLYAGCCLFASGLGAVSTLATHQAWARLAMVGYAAAALVASGQLLLVRCGRTWPPGVASRSLLAAGTAAATALAPLLLLVRGRVAGLGDRVQQEVRVVEQAGERWLDTGTPYLDRGAIAALPPGDQLGAYTPYQPAMAAFGLPRALDPAAEWWSDARLWFVAAAVAALVAAMVVLGRCDPGGTAAAVRLRAWQAATVLPTATLAAAVGGDDLPVLALCLLALALTGRSRWGAAGLAVGAAGALKLIAWPVAVVLAVHAATRGRSALVRLGAGALGVPVLALLPAVLVDPGAVAEHTVRFPLGLGLVASPAESPLPGHLIAAGLPGGPVAATGLLLAAGLAIAVWLISRPPGTAAEAATACGYGLLAAIGLLPATRFGYLLYPLALLAWAPALRAVARPRSGPMHLLPHLRRSHRVEIPPARIMPSDT